MLSGAVTEMARLLDGGAEPDAPIAARDINGTIYQSTALVEAAGRGHLEADGLLIALFVSPQHEHTACALHSAGSLTTWWGTVLLRSCAH